MAKLYHFIIVMSVRTVCRLVQKILRFLVLLHRNGDGGLGECSHFTAAWFKFILPGLSDSRKFLRSRFSSECALFSVLLHLSALLSEDGVAPDSALGADSPEVLSSPGMTPIAALCHCERKKCLDMRNKSNRNAPHTETVEFFGHFPPFGL